MSILTWLLIIGAACCYISFKLGQSVGRLERDLRQREEPTDLTTVFQRRRP